jgi:hypothetical protein
MARAWKHEIGLRPVIIEWEEGKITVQECAKRLHALLAAHDLTKDEGFTDEMHMWANDPDVTEEDVDGLLHDVYDHCDLHRIWTGGL